MQFNIFGFKFISSLLIQPGPKLLDFWGYLKRLLFVCFNRRFLLIVGGIVSIGELVQGGFIGGGQTAFQGVGSR